MKKCKKECNEMKPCRVRTTIYKERTFVGKHTTSEAKETSLCATICRSWRHTRAEIRALHAVKQTNMNTGIKTTLYKSQCATLSTTIVATISTIMILTSFILNSEDGNGENSKTELRPGATSNKTARVNTNEETTAQRRGL
jgi:hypothetical protein